MSDKGKESNNNSLSNMYQLTINNPENHGVTYDRIKEIMSDIIRPVFYCMATEKGANSATTHIHIFILLGRMLSFQAIKKCFPQAHIEGNIKGSVQENIAYIQKSGKWKYLEKGTTQIADSYYQSNNYVHTSEHNYNKKNYRSNDESLLTFLSSFNTIILFKDDIKKDNAIGNVISKHDLLNILLNEV